MIVERQLDYPDLVWGYDIVAKWLEGEDLEVTGLKVISDENLRNSHDLYRDYREAMRRSGFRKRVGKNAPHLEFANAATDDQLFRFTERYGPVICSSLKMEEENYIEELGIELTRWRLTARQNLAELRAERNLYRAALGLVSTLGRRNAVDLSVVHSCVEQIADAVWDWPSQWERELRLRKSISAFEEPEWKFSKLDAENMLVNKIYADNHAARELYFAGPDAVQSGHSAICNLVNAFNVTVTVWDKRPVEAPDWQLDCGIRPLLYYILRREYLRGGGIEVCRNNTCRQVFEIERLGQEFCSEECSRRQRQREYWAGRGKKLRTQRIRAAKKAHQKRKERL